MLISIQIVVFWVVTLVVWVDTSVLEALTASMFRVTLW